MEHKEATSFMPVIPRLDRLDRLLHLLEERHSLSRREFSSSSTTITTTTSFVENDERKDISSAIEEVQQKGTLMERLSMLESRVLQLSLDMDEENTSKSSSSTAHQVSQRIRRLDSELCIVIGEDHENVIGTSQNKDGPPIVENMQWKSRGRTKKGYKKWLGLFRFPITC